MIWHSSELEQVIAQLHTDTQKGLREEDAVKRLSAITDKIKSKNKTFVFFKRFSKEFKKVSNGILWLLAFLTLIFHFVFGTLSISTSVTIAVISVLKAAFYALLYTTGNSAMQKIQNENPTAITVLRDGEKHKISSEKLVPGDIIFVTEGDYVPADARIISEIGLHCDEFAVTGESVPAPKDADFVLEDITQISERKNMLYAGSNIVSGSGCAIVTEILDYTEVYKIAEANSDGHELLSLQPRLKQLGKLTETVFWAVYAVIFVLMFIVSLIVGTPFSDALISSAITVCTLFLCISPAYINHISKFAIIGGIKNIEKKGINILRPETVEDIASLQVICADKTGTFTQNNMAVSKLFNGINEINFASDVIDGNNKMILRLAALCCDGDVKLVNGVSVHSGDATQTAILAASMQHLGLKKYDLDNIYPRMACIPFDPNRKLMTTVNVIDGKHFMIIRGGVEQVAEKCINNTEPYLAAAKAMSVDGLRTVGVAVKVLEDDTVDFFAPEAESKMNFIGVIGLADLVRADSKKAVEECKNAGMRVIMLTGDNKETALAVAQKLGIASDLQSVLSGTEIDAFSDEQLCECIDKYTVFSHVDTRHRERIVSAFKDNGYSTAVTGDDIKNAASLRIADVGYSMGNSGTDVAINESQVVIKDDSFFKVVESVRDCRAVFANISKAIKYFFISSVTLILSVLFGIIFFKNGIFGISQIFTLSVFAITFMCVALAFERSEPGDINIIVDNDLDIFKVKYLVDVLFYSAVNIAVVMLAFIYGKSICHSSSPQAFAIFGYVLSMIVTFLILRKKDKPLYISKTDKLGNLAVLSLLLVLFATIILFPAAMPLGFKNIIILLLITSAGGLLNICIKQVRGL